MKGSTFMLQPPALDFWREVSGAGDRRERLARAGIRAIAPHITSGTTCTSTPEYFLTIGVIGETIATDLPSWMRLFELLYLGITAADHFVWKPTKAVIGWRIRWPCPIDRALEQHLNASLQAVIREKCSHISTKASVQTVADLLQYSVLTPPNFRHCETIEMAVAEYLEREQMLAHAKFGTTFTCRRG